MESAGDSKSGIWEIRMRNYTQRDAYRTERHAFVPIEPFYHARMKESTGCPQAKVFHAVIDTIPGPVSRHETHLRELAHALGIHYPTLCIWKGIMALVLPGNNKFKLAKQKGVKSMTPDELDEVMLDYHAFDMGVRAARTICNMS